VSTKPDLTVSRPGYPLAPKNAAVSVIGAIRRLKFVSNSENTHPNVAKVRAAAEAAGLTIAVRRFPEGTKTAQDAADAIGVTLGQIVKSLVFAVDGEVLLALVSGSNQLDEKKLALAAGGQKCARVDADIVRQATGFAIGGVPPFGHSTQLRIFIDPDLLQYDGVGEFVWAAAGTWNDVFPIAPNDLVRASGAVVTDLKR
jgi:prolyl-tRNA editing enzyme YbaK/EbsC (Cys-tRNA(Pro) deacylase)